MSARSPEPHWLDLRRSPHGLTPTVGIARTALAARITGGTQEEPAVTDWSLLSAHIAGDRQAFGELVRRHRDRLWRLAMRVTRDPDEAEDALHDALLRAFRRADTWSRRASPVSWLSRVVINSALDVVLKRPRTTPVSVLNDGEFAPAAPVDPTDLRTSLRAALMELEPNQRAVFVLVALRDLTHAEVADLLGVQVGTSKVLLHRARAHLARLLADHLDDEEGQRS